MPTTTTTRRRPPRSRVGLADVGELEFDAADARDKALTAAALATDPVKRDQCLAVVRFAAARLR